MIPPQNIEHVRKSRPDESVHESSGFMMTNYGIVPYHTIILWFGSSLRLVPTSFRFYLTSFHTFTMIFIFLCLYYSILEDSSRIGKQRH